MLNRFYKYLTDKLINYFQESKIKGGERFYLQFDNEEQVDTFYEFLKSQEISEEFNYKHEQGVPYSTFAMKINDMDVVVAATNGSVTPDFLVTLRNEVGMQKDEWKNTALLSVCYENLDSIRGGSSDLQKEGMPLNVKNILKNLEEVIDKNETLDTEHKEILKFHLKKKKEESFIQSSLWDYTEILGFLTQGEIKKDDYAQLGLFYDSNLNQFSKGQMKNRLEDNHSLFQQVQHIHEYENLQNQLEKLFDDRGIQLLKKEDWKENEYSVIRSSYENSLQADNPIEYIEGKGNLTGEGLQYWEKPQMETKAGQRKRHIIIFNPDKLDSIEMSFEFNDRLRKEFIHKKSEAFSRISGKKLIVNLEHNPETTTFHQVVYTHNNQSKSRHAFNIAIIGCNPGPIEDVKTLFEVNVKEKNIALNRRDEMITFGSATKDEMEEVSIEEMGQTLSMDEKGIIISDDSPAWVDDHLHFLLRIQDSNVPFVIKEVISKVTPISGMRIWKLIRENEADFSYDVKTNKLKQNSREFSASSEVKAFLMDEIEWVKKGFLFAERSSRSLKGKSLELDAGLAESYEKLLDYYRHENLIPSLAYLDDELVDLSEEYVARFIRCISEIKDDSIMNERTKNLFRLGTIHETDRILLSPLHPLNVAYQMEVRNRLQDEPIDLHILERMNPNNLLPYLYGETDKLYRPVSQQDAPHWMVYEPIQKVAIGESNAFLSHVVEEKLKQFVEHFPFLFLNQSKSPIRLNVINISNDEEIVRGLIEFLKKQIQKNGTSGIIPIEISIYSEGKQPSAFERFSMIDEAEELEQAFKINLKTNNLDKVDVLRLVRDNILYYRRSNHEYDYAHISFYKMVSNDRPATNRMDEIDTGLSLGGLISSRSFLETENDYRTGFGTKDAENDDGLLVKLAKSVNELASNLEYNGVKPYRKGEAIVTRTAAYDTEVLNRLYDASYWVTFIEPSVDLGFFQSSSRNLLIIHYSDQYSSSTQYDAITVTDKSNQYRTIIEQYLKSRDINATEKEINQAILAFNSFNGEWLLRIIGNKSQFSREKLSIVSAIKYTLSILDHGDIHWIPVSLEEIIRIAGVTRLTKNEGVFSAKNLNVNGVHSDDLLLIGLESREDQVFVHYYPVEVKLGLNTSGAINKGKEQIKKTYQLFKTQLSQEVEDGRKLFKNQFFRNFFIQILLSNMEKLIENGIWKEKDYGQIFSIKERLLNDDYELSTHLSPFIGNGAVLSFKTNQTWKSVKREDDILMIELTEDDGYSGVVSDIEELKNTVQQGNTDIDPDTLLVNRYQFIRGAGITASEKEEPEEAGYQEVPMDHDDRNEQKDDIADSTALERPIEDVRVLLGTADGSKKDIFWEYGHPELANRHLLISGKSGQGKSYFIQCLLLELSKQGVSNIIFDYTDGFKSSKLEPEFKTAMGDNLEQFLVALNKFPINPFKRNQKELDEDIYIDEDDTDIAERIKAVFSAVFKDLGIQQQNAIYEAVLRGLNKFGASMSLELLISELEEDSSGPAKTARSQIKPLIDKNPFKNQDNYNWDELIKQKGKVFIIQLTGYNREVQMMITEFILWDLWNHLLNHGDKNKPLTVVLDEAQNLDHREKSPSAKILTEGRKFGWSGSYATQSFKGQFSSDEISRLQGASQKIYFMPPENEISSIASNLARDNQEKKIWEESLSRLKKGQCIVSGPILQKDGSLAQGSPTIINIKSLMERNR